MKPETARAIANDPWRRANVRALHDLAILDSAAEPTFDHIVAIAARIFDVPTVLVSLLDEDRQWFKARVGMDAKETPIDVSFCAHAVRGDGLLVVPDATQDDRFCDNPLVTKPDGIRFYAGAPLVCDTGASVGTLCLIDKAPRPDLAPKDRWLLSHLARLTVELLEGRASQSRLDLAQRRLSDFAASALDLLWESDSAGRLRAFEDDLPRETGAGFSKSEGVMILGDTLYDLPPLCGQRSIGATLRDALDSRAAFRDIRYTRNIDGADKHISISGKPVLDERGNFQGYRGALRDVTDQEEMRLQTLRLAQIDPLTGLANRSQWSATLDRYIGSAHLRPATVLLMDIDRFKDVNDALGHGVGDQILIALANRVRRVAAGAAIFARNGSDEMAVLLDGDAWDAYRLAEKIREAAKAPLEIEGHNLAVTMSIGLREIDDTTMTADDVMLGADLALRSAKTAGADQQATFKATMKDDAERRIALISRFDEALKSEQFELFYQPQFSLSDNRISGMEALLRWHHPQDGVLAPGRFLDALENSAFDVAVGRWAINSACEQIRHWSHRGLPVRVGVNISNRQLFEDDLHACIAEAIDRHDIPASLLEIEITERVALGNAGHLEQVLSDISDLGVSIAFDDFGTGFASLSSLTRFPIDRVKIDRSFVSNVLTSRQDAKLTSSLLKMCHALELQVIAEGVEEMSQQDFLSSYHCDEVQGYLHSRPVNADEATRFLSAHRRAA